MSEPQPQPEAPPVTPLPEPRTVPGQGPSEAPQRATTGATRAARRRPGSLLKRLLRATALALLTLVLVAGGVFYYLWTFYNGPALGERLARSFNKNARGRVTIASVRWSPRAVLDLFTGRPHKILVEDLRFFDSQGRLVMHFPRIEGFGKLWPAIRHGHMLVSHGEADEAFFRIDYYRRPDGPSRGSGNLFEVGLISLFEGREHRPKKHEDPTHYFFESLSLRRASITFHHPLFELYFHRIEAQGSLHVASATDSRPAKIRFSVKPKGGEGSLRVAGHTLPLRQIDAPYVRTDPEVPTNLSFAVAGLAGGARFRLNALIEGFHSVEDPIIRLEGLATGFAEPLSEATRLALEGGSETLSITVRGPLQSPLLEARMEGLSARLRWGERTLLAEDVRALWRLQERRLTLENLTCQTLEGALSLKGSADLGAKSFGGQLRLHHLRITPLLATDSQRALLGGLLEGHVDFRGSLAPRGLEVTDLQLGLLRQDRDTTLPRQLRLQGSGAFDGRKVSLKQVELKGTGLRLTGKGEVNLAEDRLRLAVQAEVTRLGQALHNAGLGDLARGIALHGRVRGTLRNPTLMGQVTLRGAGTDRLRSRQLTSEVTAQGGTLAFRRLQGDLAGGMLGGQGHLGLFDRRWRPHRRPYLDGRFLLVGASLGQLLPGRQAHGSVTAHFSLKGLPGALTGRGGVVLRNATVGGQRIEHGSATVRLDRHRVTLQPLAVRWKGGGRLEAHGSYHLKGGKLNLEGHLWELPLQMLLASSPALRDQFRGKVSGRFHLRGSEARPLLEAMARVAEVEVRGTPLGEGTATLMPQEDGTRLRGSFFERFHVDGFLHLVPHPRVTLRVTFQNLAVHELVPQPEWLPGRAEVYASGRLEVTLDSQKGLTRLDAVLTHLEARLEQKEVLPGETPGRLVFSNEGNLLLRYDGRRLHLVQVRLSGPAGVLALTGWFAPEGSKVGVNARLNLEHYRWLASRTLDDLKGRIWLTGELTGSLSRPRFSSEAWLAGLVILPADRRVPVRIPTAHLLITHRALRIQKARVAVDTDEFDLSGQVHLRQLRPQTLDLALRGKLSAQILRLVIPHTFNHVTGRARAALRIQGPLDDPTLSGRVRLDPIAFTLRGSGREFAIQGGNLEISNRRMRIKELRGSVDDGTYVIDGALSMGRSWPWDMDLVIRGQGIPVKKSRAYELELNTRLRFRCREGKTSLSGLVDVADGRYTEPFDVVSRAFLKRRIEDAEPALWESNPLLRDAQLNLIVATQGPLLVKNNLADIRLEGNITLGGTPQTPTIGGRITAESGTFRIPFLRGEYTVQSGEVDFDHPFGFGETYVRIVGEMTYTDLNETEHEINLTLEGPVSRIAIKLTSSTGLNQSQIVMLLASGRTVDDLRRQVRTTSGGTSGRSANPLDAYDSSLKQVTGDFLSQLMAKPLQSFTKLDLVRMEMGTESFQVRLNKNLGRNVRLAGEAEFGLLGRQRQEGRVEVRMLDNLSLDARARRLIPGEDTVIEEDRYQGRLELRYQIDLRQSLRRSLGF